MRSMSWIVHATLWMLTRREAVGSPGPGERGAGAAEPRLHHAVKLVDATHHRLYHRSRVADPHEVTRPIGGQFCQRRLEGGKQLLTRLPHRQAADPVTVELQAGDVARALLAHRLTDAALDDAEQGLAASRVSQACALGPGRGPLHGEPDDVVGARQWRAPPHPPPFVRAG